MPTYLRPTPLTPPPPSVFQEFLIATSSIFTAILAGIVLGVLGRLIVPGRQAIGWIMTFVLGILGAFIGGFLAEGLNLDVWWHVLIVQAVVAAVLVFLAAGFWRSRSNASVR